MRPSVQKTRIETVMWELNKKLNYYRKTILIRMIVIKTKVNTDSSDPTTSRTPIIEHSVLPRHERSIEQYFPSTDRLLPKTERM